ncbi:methyl farnesoate epoxidase-like [Bacillus rossius redtenbacheri]|uniref:methyl farnesoate epoxidase-like n=1 Tax=Bacillus rossius redtenbacheri TaxID=93214 RepID=UPI002FDD300F
MWLAAVLALCIVVLLWLRTRRPRRFPPGPPSLPLIGSLLSAPRRLVHLKMAEWRGQYGPLVGLMMGSQPMVLACGPEAAREMLRREEFQGRPDGFFFRERSFGQRLGVIFSDGPFWVEQRRFTLRHLRDLGFSKSIMTTVMHDEFEELAREMKEQGIVQVSGRFNLAVVNVLWAVVAGQRFSHDDRRLLVVLDRLQRAFRAGDPAGNLYSVLPALRHLAPSKSGYRLSKQSIAEIQQLLREIIQDHEKKLHIDHPRDFIDIYLREIQMHKGNGNSTFTEEGLITLCLDLFTAGSETVSNTLGFCLLYMVLYPEVQKTAQEELDREVGSRKPLLEDRIRLPYVEAVLAEVTRINGVAPVTAPHRCTQDTSFLGYVVPKDAMVMASLHSLHHDQEHWGDPEVFRPARFLDAEGNYVRDDWCCVFSLGKRACLGEALARNSLFVFFACLLQEFSFSLPEGDPPPSTWPQSGLTTAPQPFRVRVSCRA